MWAPQARSDRAQQTVTPRRMPSGRTPITALVATCSRPDKDTHDATVMPLIQPTCALIHCRSLWPSVAALSAVCLHQPPLHCARDGRFLMSQSDEDDDGGASPVYEYAATNDMGEPQWDNSVALDAPAARDAEDPAALMAAAAATTSAATVAHSDSDTHAGLAVPMELDDDSIPIKAESNGLSLSAAAAALPTPPTSGSKRKPHEADDAHDRPVDENSAQIQLPAEKRSRITVEAVVGTVSAAVAPASSSSPPSSPAPVLALRPHVRGATFSAFDSAAPTAQLAPISDSDNSSDDEEAPIAANPPVPVAAAAGSILLPPPSRPVAAASALAPIPDSSSGSDDEEVEAIAVVRPAVTQQRRAVAAPPAARSPSDPIAVDEHRTVYAPTFLRHSAPVALPLAPLDDLDGDAVAAAPASAAPVPVPAPRARRPPLPRLRRQHLDQLCRVEPALALALAGSAAATECSIAGSSSQAAAASAPNLPRPRPLPSHLSWVASAGDRRRFRFRFHRTVDHARAALPPPLSLEIFAWERGQRLVPLVPLPGAAFDPRAAGCDAVRLFRRTFPAPMQMRNALDWMDYGFGRVCDLLRNACSRQQQSATRTRTQRARQFELGRRKHRTTTQRSCQLTFSCTFASLLFVQWLARSIRILHDYDKRRLQELQRASSSGGAVPVPAPAPCAHRQLRREAREAERFFRFLNAFVLSPAFQRTAQHHHQHQQLQGRPAVDAEESRRALFVLRLSEHCVDLFHLSSMQGLSPPEACLAPHSGSGGGGGGGDVGPHARAFGLARRVASLYLGLHLQVLSEVMWLYDQQLLKYDLRALREHRRAMRVTAASGAACAAAPALERNGVFLSQSQSDAQDLSVPSGYFLPSRAETDTEAENGCARGPGSGPAYFPFFSFVEHVLQGLLGLSHRHPGLCSPAAAATDGAARPRPGARGARGGNDDDDDDVEDEDELEGESDEEGLEGAAPSSSTADDAPTDASGEHSEIQWMWQPLLSCWMKLVESLHAFDHTLLHLPADPSDPDRARAFARLWASSEGEGEVQGEEVCEAGAAAGAFSSYAAAAPEWLGTRSRDVYSKTAALLEHVEALKRRHPGSGSGGSDSAPVLCFWHFFRMVASQMLDVPSPSQSGSGPTRHLEPVAVPAPDPLGRVATVQLPAAHRARLVLEALRLGEPVDAAPAHQPQRQRRHELGEGLADEVDALERALAAWMMPRSGSGGGSDGGDDNLRQYGPPRPTRHDAMRDSTVPERMESLWEVLFGALLPVVATTAPAAFSGWEASMSHRPLERARLLLPPSGAEAAAGTAVAAAARGPFMLLACLSAPRASDSPDPALGPQAHLLSLSHNTDWTFFRVALGRAARTGPDSWAEVLARNARVRARLEAERGKKATAATSSASSAPASLSDDTTAASYPALFLARVLQVQRRALLGANNFAAECDFITHTLLRSRWVAERPTLQQQHLQPQRRQQQRGSGGSGHGTSGFNPRPRPSEAFPTALPAPFTLSNDPITSAQFLSALEAGATSGGGGGHAHRSKRACGDFFSLVLRCVHQFLVRALRPVPHWAALFGLEGADSSAVAGVGVGVDAATAQLVSSLEARARQLAAGAGEMLVTSMLRVFADADAGHGNGDGDGAPGLAFRTLVPGIGAHFSDDGAASPGAGAGGSAAAHSNLLVLQRRACLVLTACLVLPRKSQAPLLQHLAGLASSLGPPSGTERLHSALVSSAAIATSSHSGSSSGHGSGTGSGSAGCSSREAAFTMLLHSLLVLVRIRQDSVDHYSEGALHAQALRPYLPPPRWGAAQLAREGPPPLHGFSLLRRGPTAGTGNGAGAGTVAATAAAAAVATVASLPLASVWLLGLSAREARDECSYSDVLAALVALYLEGPWATFLAAEQLRVVTVDFHRDLMNAVGRAGLEPDGVFLLERLEARSATGGGGANNNNSGANERRIVEAVVRAKRHAALQQERERYLVALLRALLRLAERKAGVWTPNEVDLLHIAVPAPAAPAPLPPQPPVPAVPGAAAAPSVAAAAVPVPAAPAPASTLWLVQLLSTEGPLVRVPPSLREVALQLLVACMPIGKWLSRHQPGSQSWSHPRSVGLLASASASASASLGAGASLAAHPSLLDDEDDDAMGAFDLAAWQMQQQQRAQCDVQSVQEQQERARAAEAERVRRAKDQLVRAEQQKLRSAYLESLSTLLKRTFQPVLLAFVACNMHDAAKMRDGANRAVRTEIDRVVLAVNSAGPAAAPGTLAASMQNSSNFNGSSSSSGSSPAVIAGTIQHWAIKVHFFPSDGRLQRQALEALIVAAFVMVGAHKLEWRALMDWGLRLVPLNLVGTAAAPPLRAATRPLCESLILRAHSMLTSTELYAAAPAQWPFRDSPQLHLGAWLRAMLDASPATQRDLAEFTRTLLAYCAVGQPGAFAAPLAHGTGAAAASHSPLAHFFWPRSRFEEWTSEQMQRFHGGSDGAGGLAGPALTQWFRERGRLLALVLQAYERKFSPHPPSASSGGRAATTAANPVLGPGSSSRPSLVGCGPSSSNVSSIFADFGNVMLHSLANVATINSAEQGGDFLVAYASFFYAFLGQVAERCGDCLVVGSATDSFAIVRDLQTKLVRVQQPGGSGAPAVYAASVASVPGLLRGLAAFLPVPGATNLPTAMQPMADVFVLLARGVPNPPPSASSVAAAADVREQVHALWADYMHAVHVPAFAARFADQHRPSFAVVPLPAPAPLAAPTIDRAHPLFALQAQAQAQAQTQHARAQTAAVAAVDADQSEKIDRKRLFAAWRHGLMTPSAAAGADDACVTVDPSPAAAAAAARALSLLSPVRQAQRTLLRRYVLALHVSHALFQSVLLKEGEVRTAWAADLLAHLVRPMLRQLPKHESVLTHFVFLFFARLWRCDSCSWCV